MIVYRTKEEVLKLNWLKNPKPLRNRGGGVYRIVDKKTEKLLYIGQTSNLSGRLAPSVHPIFRKEIHDVYIIFESNKNERYRMEWSFIQLLKPEKNEKSGLQPSDGKDEFLTEQYNQLFNF